MKRPQDGRTRRFPPSLSSARTQLDKLYDDLGGPAPIGGKVLEKSAFKSACDQHPLQRITPLLSKYCDDENAIRRHWPWAAFAIEQYVFEVQERRKYTDKQSRYVDKRSPKEWVKLLNGISKSARDLFNFLGEIQTVAYRLANPQNPNRRAHIAWLEELFAKAAAGRADSTDGEDWQKVIDHFAKKEFLDRLIDIDRTAKEAIKHLDWDLLNRERPQNNPALPSFVWRIAQIWESLTGRVASAERLNLKDREDPDFVLLIKGLAELRNMPLPTRLEVATSLLTIHPTD